VRREELLIYAGLGFHAPRQKRVRKRRYRREFCSNEMVPKISTVRLGFTFTFYPRSIRLLLVPFCVVTDVVVSEFRFSQTKRMGRGSKLRHPQFLVALLAKRQDAQICLKSAAQIQPNLRDFSLISRHHTHFQVFVEFKILP
jgi:hypothetical protein